MIDNLLIQSTTFSIEIPPESSVELSSRGYDFFTQLFTTFDKDKDGALKESELENLFSTSPGNPWRSIGFPETTITNESGAVTLQGFLAQWSLTTLLDHKLTLAYLAYLGYDGDTTLALKVTKPRRVDRRRSKKVPRNVFLCYVFGGTGSGKSALLKGLVQKPFTEQYSGSANSRTYSVVNSVEIGGAEKYLVMQEFGPKHDHEVLSNRKRVEAADVLVFVYDSSDVNSFAYVANLRVGFVVFFLVVMGMTFTDPTFKFLLIESIRPQPSSLRLRRHEIRPRHRPTTLRSPTRRLLP